MRSVIYFGLLLSFFSSVSQKESVEELVSTSEIRLFEADFAESIILIDSAIQLAREAKSTDLYFQLMNQKGHIMTRMGSYDSSASLHQQALTHSIETRNTSLEFETRYYIGVLKLFMSEFEEAEKLFLEVTDFFGVDVNHDGYLIARSLSNLAFLAFQKRNYKEATELIQRSFKYYVDDPTSIYAAANYNLKGLIAKSLGDYDVAIGDYLKSLEIYQLHNRHLNLCGLYLNLAGAYAGKSDLVSAEQKIAVALEAAERKRIPSDLIAVYGFLYQYKYDQGSYKSALDFLMKKNTLEDSLRNSENVLEVASLEIRFAEKLDSLQTPFLQEKLSAEKKIIEAQRISMLTVVLVLLFIIFIISVYRRLIRDKNNFENELIIKNNQLEEKTKQIAKAQNLLIQSEKMALLGRISAGIADEISKPISAINGNLELISNLQELELEKLNVFSGISLTEKQVSSTFLLIKESFRNMHQPEAFDNVSNRKKAVTNFFSNVEIPRKDQVIDYFIELNVDSEIHRFDGVYGSKYNTDLLEVVSHVVNRVKAVKTASAATVQASKILKSFKTYSFKRGWKNVTNVDLSSSIDVMLDLYKNDLKNIEIIKSVEGDSKVEGIDDELDQVWTNLISNALYAMSSQGVLRISVKGLSDAVSVSIQDTGGGVYFAEGNDIFEPFYTTKPEGEGSGLGLDICKQIIKNHFGSISWKNTDNGANFTVVLPRIFEKSHVLNR